MISFSYNKRYEKCISFKIINNYSHAGFSNLIPSDIKNIITYTILIIE